jgi:hypothetical protein
MTNFTIAKTLIGGTGRAALHRSVVGIPLAWRLIAILLLGALVAILLLVLRMLLIQIAIPLSRRPMVPLLIALWRVVALTSVASRGMSLKPPLLGFHLLALIINHNGTIHKRLEVGVGVGHKLQLKTII